MELLNLTLKQQNMKLKDSGALTVKAEVTGNPIGVIPHSKLGINLMVMTLIQKYALHTPLNKIISFQNCLWNKYHNWRNN